MKRRRRVSMLVAFVMLLALVALFFLRLSHHRPPPVELPAQDQEANGEEIIAHPEQETLRRVEVTPQTVQLVIERLARPTNYRRTIAVERFWDGGSAIMTASVSVAEGWTRVDSSNLSDDTRHSITSSTESWIWYGESRSVYHGAASLTADEEQSIPTYEDILRLDTARIAAADYRALGELNCIYVETAPDDALYTERYFIAVDSGLLVSMEREQNGATAYQMTALSVELDTVEADAFTLPDGTVLFDPQPILENEENEGESPSFSS